MKIQKFTSKVFVCILLFVGVCGCFRRKDRTYQGPQRVEFFPLNTSVKSPKTVTLKVQLIGHQRSKPLKVFFTVVKGVADADPNWYSFSTDSSIVIPPNKSKGELKVKINDGFGSNSKLFIRLTRTSEPKVKPALNVSTARIVIQ